MIELRPLSLAVALLGLLAVGPGLRADDPVNTLQDCWTSNVFIELEDYQFAPEELIIFSWGHRIERTCSSYSARLLIFACEADPKTAPEIALTVELGFGAIEPDPMSTTRTFSKQFQLGDQLEPGLYDWGLLVECDDSGNGVPFTPDGDFDDSCGLELGEVARAAGPQPLGPLDVSPGGDPPGRQPGENGTTRPWCFEVVR